MPTTNSAVYNAYGKKKRNSLAPYLDAGNSSASGNMQLTTPQPTGANTRLYNAYAGAGTQPKATTKVARAYSSAVTPADTAYRNATSPTAANPTQAQYQPGEILRRSAANGNANNAQPAAASADQTGVVSAPAAQSTGAAQTGGQTALQRAYGSQNSSGNTYGADRQSAINAATASYNKLLNYLPEYNELMGMRGLGVSEQALLNAQRDYAQNIADINATYDEMEQAYRDTQISNVNTLSAELSAYINDAGENFTQEGYERFKQGMLQAGYTAEELAAAENLLTQSDRNIMNNANNNSDANKSYISNIEKPFEYNGKYYQIESKLDKNANQIVRNNDFKKQLKDMGYSNLFDENIPNGTTIITHVDNRGSNDFNWWDDVGAFLLSPFGAGAWDSWGNWNEISMTYYDGDWYLSKVVSV